MRYPSRYHGLLFHLCYTVPGCMLAWVALLQVSTNSPVHGSFSHIGLQSGRGSKVTVKWRIPSPSTHSKHKVRSKPKIIKRGGGGGIALQSWFELPLGILTKTFMDTGTEVKAMGPFVTSQRADVYVFSLVHSRTGQTHIAVRNGCKGNSL